TTGGYRILLRWAESDGEHWIQRMYISTFGATRLVIPGPGTADPDHNPPRIAARHLFDLAVGTDNLLKTDRTRMSLRFTVVNLTNNVALYNFLSTFSGTHFVAPRTYQAAVGVTF